MTNQEINEAVARKLNPPPDGCAYVTGFEKPYSTDIKAAWEIVGHILKHPKRFVKIIVGDYDVTTAIIDEWGKHIADTVGYWSETAESAPRAICEAFLKLP
jgi:hypothetical protein